MEDFRQRFRSTSDRRVKTSFDKLQNQRSHELMSSEITNYDANKIIEAITQVANDEDFLQHYLAADNVYADSEFCNSNVFD